MIPPIDNPKSRFMQLSTEGQEAFAALGAWLESPKAEHEFDMREWFCYDYECGAVMCMGGFLDRHIFGKDGSASPYQLYDRLGVSREEGFHLFFATPGYPVTPRIARDVLLEWMRTEGEEVLAKWPEHDD